MNLAELSKTFSNWFVVRTPVEDSVNREISGLPVDLIALEERVLYSAAPLPADFLESVDFDRFENVDFLDNIDQHLDIILHAVEDLGTTDDPVELFEPRALDVLSGDGNLIAKSTVELVVIDNSIENYLVFVENLVAQNSDDRQFELIHINSGIDGVQQISDYLKNNEQVFDALHLVTHGSDGQILLGDSTLNASSLTTYENEIQSWSASFAGDADLLIYGCNVAATESGENFVNDLSGMLGLDVAASDDVTGHGDLSGDWDFEYRVGAVQNVVAFTIDVQENWLGALEIADASSQDGAAGSVEVSDNGDIVRAFSSDQPAGSDGLDVYYVLSDHAQTTFTTEIRVNESTTGTQNQASVAIADNGDKIFVWTSDHGGPLGVYAKLVDENGTTIKSEFQVDQGNGAENASVAMDDSGNFVIAWQATDPSDPDGGVFVQYFDEFGNTVDSTILVNQTRTGVQGNPDVSTNNNNEFVVSWDTFDLPGQEAEVFARKYVVNPGLGTVTDTTSEITVAGNFGQIFSSPDVDLSDTGAFAVAYTTEGSDFVKSIDGTGTIALNAADVNVLTFDQTGTFLNDFGGVNETLVGDQHSATIVVLEDSTPLDLNDNIVVVTWEGNSTVHGDAQGVYYRTYAFDGTPIETGEQLVMPTAVTGDQLHVSIAKYAAGTSFAIGFEGFESGVDSYHVAPLALPPNLAPDGTDNTILINEDQVYVLSEIDFGYTDPEDDSFDGVEINSLPTTGQLLVSGIDAVVGQFVSETLISGGQLTYVAAQDFLVTTDDSFEFIVNDGAQNSATSNLLTFTVSPLNDAVQIVANNPLSIDEGDTGTVISNAYLSTTDVDDAPLEIEYEIIIDVTHGKFYVGGSPLNVGSTFTQDDIDSGRIMYDHDGLESNSDFFQFVVRDGLEDGAAPSISNFVININPVNDEQIATVSVLPVPISPGATLILNSSHLSASDVDNTDDELVFTITTPPAEGQIELDGVLAASFTQQNLIDGRVTYVNDGSLATADQFQFAVDDGQGTVSAGTLNFTLISGDGFILSSKGNQTLGATSWDGGDAVGFGGGSLMFGSPTAGEAVTIFDTSYKLDGLHFVSQTVTVNTPGSPTVLQQGDFLFSIGDISVSTIPGIATATDNDIILFRPGSPGDYDFASGSFSILVTLPEVTYTEVWSLTLVERDTMIGDYGVSEGDILFTSKFPIDNDIQLLEITPTVNNISVLIDGDEIGVDGAILGIELIEKDITVGGVTLTEGTLLLASTSNEFVGVAGVTEGDQQTAGGLQIQNNDVFAIEIATTTLAGGPASGTASMFYDASTVSGLTGGPSGDIDAIALVSLDNEEIVDVNKGLTVAEGATLAITDNELHTSDLDDAPGNLTYTITSATTEGTILVSGVPLMTFTQADIDAGDVSYAHGGGELALDSFTFTVDDGTGSVSSESFNINITPVNDEQSLDVSSGQTVAEGQSVVITSTELATSDVDNTSAQIVYTVTSGPGKGSLFVGGSPTSSFTQANIDVGQITYQHNGSEPTPDSFDFDVDDGSGSVSNGTFNFTVTPVNDEQSLDVSSNKTVAEGMSVVITSTELATSDDDNSPSQIVYTLTSPPANGSILVGGTPAVSFTQADVDAGQVSYLHDGSETSLDSFNFDVDDGLGAVSPGSFGITVTPMSDPPVASDNVYGVSHGGSATFGIDYGLLYNDSDIEGDPLTVTNVTVSPLNGTLVVNPDGTFTYTHDGSPTTTDSFEYEIFDGNNVDTATVEIHIDECGFENTPEFLVNQGTTGEPLANDQNTSQYDRLGNTAIAARANGDYVVTWSSVGSDGSHDVFVRLFDFSGTAITDQIQVNEHLPDAQFGSSVAMAKDGSFVVTWMSENQDGTASSIYYRHFDSDGTPTTSEQRVTDNSYSVGEQRNPAISMNSLGQYTIAWDGAKSGGPLHDIYGQRYEADGTLLGSTILLNDSGLGSEYNASVVMLDDASLFAVWDDDNEVNLRNIASDGTKGAVSASPSRVDILDMRHSSVDTNADGLVALAYQTQVSDITGVHWEVHLQVFDPANPVMNSNPIGAQFTTGDQVYPDVSLNDDGSILMTWHGEGVADANDVFGRKFIVATDGGGDYFAQATSDEFLVAQTTSGTQFGSSIAALDSENFVVVWSGEGVGDADGVFARQFGNQTSYQATGSVLEDVNADGNLTDRVAVENATVKLYEDDGDGVINSGDRLVRVTSTDVNGDYTFGGLKDGLTYWSVVDSKTVQSSASLNGGFTNDDAWAEQTYGDGGVKFGGLVGGDSDDASSLVTAQHVSQVKMNGDQTDIDFGFSFNVVTNTTGGDAQDDDTAINQRSVQGSLRQFITNANAIAGDNEMRFVPVSTANRTSGANAWWEVAISVALPEITDAGTTIDGRAYSTDGVTLLDSNSSVHGYVGAVGLGADGVAGTGDEILLDGVDAPELEISAIAGVAKGITVNAANVEIAYISIYGFGQGGTSSGNIFVESAGEYVQIHDNMIGAEADSFTAPTTAADQIVNVNVDSADHGLIANNLIGYSTRAGIEITGTSDYADSAQGWTISGNEIRSNAHIDVDRDGIDLYYDVEDTTISGNLIADNHGYGIDAWAGLGGYTIVDNTITGNGLGGDQTGGIRLFGTGSTVEHNVITDNTGSGINVIGDHRDGSQTFGAATGNLISQNEFSGNSGNAIDLMSASNNTTIFDQGDGVSPNGVALDLNAGNEGLDYPELVYAQYLPDGLHVAGRIEPTLNIDRLELYVASGGSGDIWSGSDYGEGSMYIGTLPVSALTIDLVTGDFSGILSTPPPGGWAAVTTGQPIAAIAIDANNNTSEFGNNLELILTPIAVDSNVTFTEDNIFVFAATDFGFLDTPGDTLASIRIDSLPSDGTLIFKGVAITSPGVNVTAAELSFGDLIFDPDVDVIGTPLTTFDFSVNDGLGFSVAPATMDLNVDPDNDFPTGSGATFTTLEDTLLVIDGTGPTDLLTNVTDIDGDTLSVTPTVLSGPSNGTLSLNTDGTFSYDPADDFFGVDSFMYEVTDGNGGSIIVTATINIDPVNDDPELVDPGVVNVTENTLNVATVTSTDVDGGGPSYSIEGSGDDDALFDVLGNQLVFKSKPDFENPASLGGTNTYFVDVRVDDGVGGFDIDTITVNVADAADNPQALDDTYWVDEGEDYDSVSSLLDNDVDGAGDGITTTLVVVGPLYGSIILNPDGTFEYDHDGSETVIDSFVYEVVAADGQTDTAMVTININPVQDATIVNDDGIFELDAGESIVVTSGTILANDVDVDSTSLAIVIVDQPDDGFAFIDADGNLVFTADSTFVGLDQLQYVVIADNVTSGPATVTFDVLLPSAINTNPGSETESEDSEPESTTEMTPPPSSDDDSQADDKPSTADNTTKFNDSTADTVESSYVDLTDDSDDLISERDLLRSTYAFADPSNLAIDLGQTIVRAVASGRTAVTEFDPIMLGVFWDDLDSAKRDFLMKFDLSTPTITASVTSFLTVGYLAWIVRGGVLLTTFMSSLPAWQAFDPLPVIESSRRDEEEDDQSIAEMVDN